MSRFAFVTLGVCAGLMGQAPDFKSPGALSLPAAEVVTPGPIGPSVADGAGALKAANPDGTVVTADIQAARRFARREYSAGRAGLSLPEGMRQAT